MNHSKIVSKGEWLKARVALLEQEKAQSNARDKLTQARQAMPWTRVDKEYLFEGPDGQERLADLFEGKSQLIVYHFMFDRDWQEGCKSCSFIADHYDPSVIHLAHRDVAMVTVSIASLEKLQAYKKRMGWSFKWVSSANCDFNRDYHVSFTDEEIANKQCHYNFRKDNSFPMRQAPGISVFAKGEGGDVYHTYSAYSRGLENFLGAYTLLDIVPKGRDEDALSYGMQWLRIKDSYDD